MYTGVGMSGSTEDPEIGSVRPWSLVLLTSPPFSRTRTEHFSKGPSMCFVKTKVEQLILYQQTV